MKFSVASSICEPVADFFDCDALFEDPAWVAEGSAIVAGRLTRRRSVALGHSIYGSALANAILRSLTLLPKPRVHCREYRTSHLLLKVSKSTNSRKMVSSFKMDLY